MANVTKRGNGYRIIVSAGYDGTGKQIRKTMTWKPKPGMTSKQIKKELNKQVTLFEENVLSGRYFDGSIKFKDFAERWFKDYAKGHLRERTIERYKKLAERTYIAIGHIRIDKLRPHHLIEFYNQLEQVKKEPVYRAKIDIQGYISRIGKSQKGFAEFAGVSAYVVRTIQKRNNVSCSSAKKVAAALGMPIDDIFERVHSEEKLSPKTIKHYHVFISSIMDRAVKWQMIPENPCHRIDAPKAKHKQVLCMNEKQIQQFIKCLQEEPLQYQVIFLLLILTGIRRGELLGLEWSDFDFEKAVLSIRRTSQYTAIKGVYTDTTKTEQSKRQIALPKELIELLIKYRAEQAKCCLQMGDRWFSGWSEHQRLFTQWDGRPMHPNTPYQEMQKILKRNNMPHFSLHSLRHTNATLLIRHGEDVRTVSGRLGHSQTSTTMNVYAEYLQSANEAASEMLADILIRKNSV